MWVEGTGAAARIRLGVQEPSGEQEGWTLGYVMYMLGEQRWDWIRGVGMNEQVRAEGDLKEVSRSSLNEPLPSWYTSA